MVFPWVPELVQVVVPSPKVIKSMVSQGFPWFPEPVPVVVPSPKVTKSNVVPVGVAIPKVTKSIVSHGFPKIYMGFGLFWVSQNLRRTLISLGSVEFYEDLETLKSRLKSNALLIQCVVSKGVTTSEVAFGSTQHPKLSDYADGLDTVDFLLKI